MKRRVLVIAILAAATVAAFLLFRAPADERLVFSYRTADGGAWRGDCRCAFPVASATTLFFCGGRSVAGQERLVAVDLRTRAIRWERALSEGCGPLVVVEDAIYAWDGRAVTAYDTAGGTLWRRPELVGRPFLAAGRLYVGRAGPPALVALDPRTREVVGEVPVPALPSAPPLVEGEVVRYGTLDGRLVTLDLRDASVTATPIADRILSPLVRAGGALVFHAERGRRFALMAYDEAAGTVRWTVGTPVLSQAAPFVLGDEVFYGADQLYAVRTATGVARRIALDDSPVGSVVLHEGTLLVPGGRFLHAVDPATGAVRWRFAARGWIAAPPTGGAPLLRDGVVWFGSLDCGVYGLRVGETAAVMPGDSRAAGG